MKKGIQGTLHCPCGREAVLALGLCATCYTLKRQVAAYFGGHRETVLARDGHRCSIPGFTTVKRGKRSIVVHHRIPGENDPKLMVTLRPACHAKVSRTLVVQAGWPPLLRQLWREQHPSGHEQTHLDFAKAGPSPRATPLFEDLQPQEVLKHSRAEPSDLLLPGFVTLNATM